MRLGKYNAFYRALKYNFINDLYASFSRLRIGIYVEDEKNSTPYPWFLDCDVTKSVKDIKLQVCCTRLNKLYI